MKVGTPPWFFLLSVVGLLMVGVAVVLWIAEVPAEIATSILPGEVFVATPQSTVANEGEPVVPIRSVPLPAPTARRPSTRARGRVADPTLLPTLPNAVDSGAAESLKCRVGGRVVDAMNRPVVGARLSVTSWVRFKHAQESDVISDDSGRYSFDDLDPVTVQVHAIHETPGRKCLGRSRAILMRRGETRHDFDIVLRSGGKLSGSVITTDFEPVEGIRVNVEFTGGHSRGEGFDETVKTNAAGEWEITGLEPLPTWALSWKIRPFLMLDQKHAYTLLDPSFQHLPTGGSSVFVLAKTPPPGPDR